jgi:phosphonate transport system substrate-binding protein
MRILWCLILGLAVAGCGGEGDMAGSTNSGGGSGGDAGAGAPKILKFTAIPNTNTTELMAKYKPVAEHLSKALGTPVEYVPAGDYRASVTMFENGTVHLAWFGGLTGVQARERVKGAHAIAMGAEDKKFKTYFIAHKDAGLTPGNDFPKAIADKKFSFGSASSTSGRLMPEHFIMQNTGGKTAEEFFTGTPNFSGSHDKTIELVDSGQFQVGAVDYTAYDARKAEGKTSNCVIIWTTPEYADYNFTAHPSLGSDLTKKLQGALTSLPADLCEAFKRTKMVTSSDAEFAAIKTVAEKLDLLKG